MEALPFAAGCTSNTSAAQPCTKPRLNREFPQLQRHHQRMQQGQGPERPAGKSGPFKTVPLCSM